MNNKNKYLYFIFIIILLSFACTNTPEYTYKTASLTRADSSEIILDPLNVFSESVEITNIDSVRLVLWDNETGLINLIDRKTNKVYDHFNVYEIIDLEKEGITTSAVSNVYIFSDPQVFSFRFNNIFFSINIKSKKIIKKTTLGNKYNNEMYSFIGGKMVSTFDKQTNKYFNSCNKLGIDANAFPHVVCFESDTSISYINSKAPKQYMPDLYYDIITYLANSNNILVVMYQFSSIVELYDTRNYKLIKKIDLTQTQAGLGGKNLEYNIDVNSMDGIEKLDKYLVDNFSVVYQIFLDKNILYVLYYESYNSSKDKKTGLHFLAYDINSEKYLFETQELSPVVGLYPSQIENDTMLCFDYSQLYADENKLKLVKLKINYEK